MQTQWSPGGTWEAYSHEHGDARFGFQGTAPSAVNVNFGFSQVVACAGTTVAVTWQGTHNIQEVAGSSCASNTVGQVRGQP